MKEGNINVAGLINAKYEPKDVVKYLAKYVQAISDSTGSAVAEQNMYGLVASLSHIQDVADILKALDKKMNGQKTPTVVQ